MICAEKIQNLCWIQARNVHFPKHSDCIK